MLTNLGLNDFHVLLLCPRLLFDAGVQLVFVPAQRVEGGRVSSVPLKSLCTSFAGREGRGLQHKALFTPLSALLAAPARETGRNDGPLSCSVLLDKLENRIILLRGERAA